MISLKQPTLILGTLVLLTLTGCADSPVAPTNAREANRSNGAVALSSNLAQHFGNFTYTNGVLLDDQGRQLLPAPNEIAQWAERNANRKARIESRIAEIEANPKHQKRIAKEMARLQALRLPSNASFSRTLADVLPQLGVRSIGVQGLPTQPLFSTMCDDPTTYCGGTGGGGSATSDYCSLQGLKLYYTTVTYREAVSELSKAWLSWNIDASSFATHVAEGNLAGAAVDAAGVLVDEFAIGTWQTRVDTLLLTLELITEAYAAGGCI